MVFTLYLNTSQGVNNLVFGIACAHRHALPFFDGNKWKFGDNLKRLIGVRPSEVTRVIEHWYSVPIGLSRSRKKSTSAASTGKDSGLYAYQENRGHAGAATLPVTITNNNTAHNGGALLIMLELYVNRTGCGAAQLKVSPTGASCPSAVRSWVITAD